jgi:lysophospholipase L1-like esterase
MIVNSRYLLHLLLVMCMLSPLRGQDTERPLRDHERWAKDIAKFEQRDRERMPAKNQIVFAGSSSMVYWKTNKHFPEMVIINRGFGGSHLSDSIHYVEKVILKYEPRIVLLYAGDNDLADEVKPEHIRDDFVKLVGIIHQRLPKTKVLYIAIKPSPDRWGLFDVQERTNRLIEEVCQKDKRLKYVDIVTPMLGEDGKPRAEFYRDDGLHLNEKGYELWTSIIKPLIRE